MSGRSALTKGAAGEREAAAILSDLLGRLVKRKLGQARDGGDDLQVGKFRIEVKRRETLRVDAWCEQIEACVGPGEVPVLLYRRNGQPWRVCLRLDDFVPLMRDAL